MGIIRERPPAFFWKRSGEDQNRPIIRLTLVKFTDLNGVPSPLISDSLCAFHQNRHILVASKLLWLSLEHNFYFEKWQLLV